MGNSDLWFFIGSGILIGTGAVLFALLICAIPRIKRAIARVKLEDNILMMSLYKNIEAGTLKCLYINNYLACFNFNIIERKEVKKYAYSGTIISSRIIGHKCEITPANVIDFNKMGYQSIPTSHLRVYKQQLMDKIKTLPQVKDVTFYNKLTFAPANLFISSGKYGKQPPGYDELWVIEYQPVGHAVGSAGTSKQLG